MRIFIVLTVVGLAALLWGGCDDRTPVLSGPGAVDTLHGPLENYEAEAVAVHLSRELVAPMDLYYRVEQSLKEIRESFGDSISAVAIQYRLPWTLGRFVVKVDAILLQDSSSTTYRVFDSLNQIYRMVETRHMFLNFHSVTFANRYNPVRLVEIYGAVPGFEIMEPSVYGGDGPDVYIRFSIQGADYFFRDAWGDCPAGCIHERVHYISEQLGAFDYHGFYPPDPPDTLAQVPDWVDLYQTLCQQKFYSITWYPDSVIYRP